MLRLSRFLRLFVVVALASAAAGCFTMGKVGENAKPQQLGSVEAGSRALGTAAFSPGVCLAGEREMFLGADFLDRPQDLVFRLVWDPLEGPAVRVFDRTDPSAKSIVFRKADCRQFKASLDQTNWRINDVNAYRVSADIDCGDSDHGFVKAHLLAEHCH